MNRNYKIGGDFVHRHPGGGPTIMNIKDSPSGITLYYVDDDPKEGHTIDELDQWQEEGWIYTPPEYYENLEKERLREKALHQYPKKK